MVGPLTDAGSSIFHASTRRFWEPEFEAASLDLARWTRKLTGRPTISVGSVGLSGGDFLEQLRGLSTEASVDTLEELVERMRDQKFDLNPVGRI